MSNLFEILLSGLNSALQFVFRSVVIKFAMFFGLWYVTSEFVDVLKGSSLLPNATALANALGSLPPGVWYWLELLAVPQGLPIVLAAMGNKFVIRRIPLLG
ncbi:DUF2523 family protein [Pandoraea communis]|uniref:Putative phage-related membrane protein n=1 Tax=Pandoraea communis TaxID=2508297 RepID=A0A5E4YZR7_9BURK|nr:DUF2523 family protein [Pandoraea communis]MDM8356038.1 DUF2523 family protein [Pandoraea communis]VVE53922.1 putative phage-related membrane protein [Pandoraea communis]